MGAQCCVNDKTNNDAQLIEAEPVIVDKTKLPNEPAAIDQQVQSPAPAPAQAPAEDQVTETKPEPVEEGTKKEEIKPEATEETKAETNAKPDGMPMVFDFQGEEKTVYIQRKPLGLVFNKECPIKIINFKDNSHGQEVGIEKDWILKSLNGDDFTKLTEFKDALDLMTKHVDTLPSPN